MRRSAVAQKLRRTVRVPQECPAPDCGVDLTDPSVPHEFRHLAHQFSLVLSDGNDWLCPVCGHRWPR